MKKLIVLLIVVLSLSGCHSIKPHHEKIDGVDCIVRRNRISNHVEALSCGNFEK